MRNVMVFCLVGLFAPRLALGDNQDPPKRDVDLQKVEELSAELEDLADKFEEEVNGKHIRSKEVRKKIYRSIRSSTRTIDRAAEKVRSSGTGRVYSFSFVKDDYIIDDSADSKRRYRPWEYLYLAYNYRGAGPSTLNRVRDRSGFEAGLTIPVLHGIDLGVGVNSLFTDGASIQRSYKIRSYLFSRQRFLYLGAEYLPDRKVVVKNDAGIEEEKKRNKVAYTIGSLFGIFYGELDIVPDDDAPYKLAPEIGLRVKFM